MIVVTAIVILGQLYRVEKRRHFLEPDAQLALLAILGAFAGLYFVRE